MEQVLKTEKEARIDNFLAFMTSSSLPFAVWRWP